MRPVNQMILLTRRDRVVIIKASHLFMQAAQMNMHSEMSHNEIIRVKLSALRSEHRDLDSAIDALAAQQLTSSLTMQRLKKQKLRLKDEIARLEDELTPDIIA